ncbi:hypothetical protein, partial [Escherichia coli]|uniref:hypothetical protein n=1 Tax=Escherichia coli TaxID=562 RepID=UPI0030798F7F
SFVGVGSFHSVETGMFALVMNFAWYLALFLAVIKLSERNCRDPHEDVQYSSYSISGLSEVGIVA